MIETSATTSVSFAALFCDRTFLNLKSTKGLSDVFLRRREAVRKILKEDAKVTSQAVVRWRLKLCGFVLLRMKKFLLFWFESERFHGAQITTRSGSKITARRRLEDLRVPVVQSHLAPLAVQKLFWRQRGMFPIQILYPEAAELDFLMNRAACQWRPRCVCAFEPRLVAVINPGPTSKFLWMTSRKGLKITWVKSERHW